MRKYFMEFVKSLDSNLGAILGKCSTYCELVYHDVQIRPKKYLFGTLVAFFCLVFITGLFCIVSFYQNKKNYNSIKLFLELDRQVDVSSISEQSDIQKITNLQKANDILAFSILTKQARKYLTSTESSQQAEVFLKYAQNYNSKSKLPAYLADIFKIEKFFILQKLSQNTTQQAQEVYSLASSKSAILKPSLINSAIDTTIITKNKTNFDQVISLALSQQLQSTQKNRLGMIKYSNF